ncbi:hypothetical protein BYT27DRAFT_7218403 [Phlegmacium glaucopus]|nr:hypothetical protein BYT27DRAFT_7218403 [Phlegmacium glaucopus]
MTSAVGPGWLGILRELLVAAQLLGDLPWVEKRISVFLVDAGEWFGRKHSAEWRRRAVRPELGNVPVPFLMGTFGTSTTPQPHRCVKTRWSPLCGFRSVTMQWIPCAYHSDRQKEDREPIALSEQRSSLRILSPKRRAEKGGQIKPSDEPSPSRSAKFRNSLAPYSVAMCEEEDYEGSKWESKTERRSESEQKAREGGEGYMSRLDVESVWVRPDSSRG